MRQGQRFTDARVVWIKERLIAGVHPKVIARLEGVNLNTIVRIRDGETYAGVKVKGEEGLRPSIRVESYQPFGSQVEKREAVMIVPEVSQVEIDASLARMMGKRAPEGAKEAEEEALRATLFGSGAKRNDVPEGKIENPFE